MTDSASGQATATGQRPGKRERLVAAAAQLLHQHGVERTTLADIAQAADVPAGNVYYYFKTKDEVIAAVIEAHARQVKTTLTFIDTHHRSPRSRLKAFVREFTAQGEIVAQYGCPLGSLCSELGKRVRPSSLAEAELMRLPVEWAEKQFRSLGRRDAHDLALDLLAAYEGSALLANTLGDANLLSRAGRRLNHWIDTL
ncbi:MAG TPA: TetR/AcrR family transcriptional regulator [Streptosporangiaceae bacterium]|nr:TetR/AcrR family transcriptional regulator [Streptosporangiaceae bacterium]